MEEAGLGRSDRSDAALLLLLRHDARGMEEVEVFLRMKPPQYVSYVFLREWLRKKKRKIMSSMEAEKSKLSLPGF